MIHFQYLIAIVGNRVISFTALLLLAYVLSPQDFGIYTLAFTNANLLYALISNWLVIGGGRAVSTAADADRIPDATVGASLLAILGLLLLVCIVYAAQPLHPVPVRFVVLVLVWTAAFIVYDITGMLLSSRQRVEAYAALALSRNFAANGLCLVGAWWASSEGAILGHIVGSVGAVIVLASARSVWAGISPSKASRDVFIRMLRFGAVGTFASALYMMTSFAIRNPVAIKLGEAQAGSVALATDLFFIPVALLINAFFATQSVALNRFSNEGASARRTAALSKLLDQTALVVVPYVVGGVLLAAPLVAFVLPGQVGDRLSAIATPAALFGAALGSLYSLTGALLTFKHHRVLVALAVVTASGVFVAALSMAPSGLSAVLWASTGVASLTAAAAYVELAVRGGASVLTSARVRIVASAAVMGVAIFAYRLLNTFEPITPVLLGIAVYAFCVVKTGVIRLDELILRKLPEAPAVQADLL